MVSFLHLLLLSLFLLLHILDGLPMTVIYMSMVLMMKKRFVTYMCTRDIHVQYMYMWMYVINVQCTCTYTECTCTYTFTISACTCTCI